MGSDLSVQNLGDAIREKVKKTLFDAMPDDAIDAMIQKEFDELFGPPKYQDNYARQRNDHPGKSVFQRMVIAEFKTQMNSRLKEHVKTQVDARLEDEDHSGALERLAKEIAPGLVNAYFEGVARAILEQVKYANLLPQGG